MLDQGPFSGATDCSYGFLKESSQPFVTDCDVDFIEKTSDLSESDTSEDESGQKVNDSDVDYIEQLETQLSDAESEDVTVRHRLHKPLDAVLSPLPQSHFK